MMDRAAAEAELQKKLDPANIKPAKQYGPKGDYIESWHAIAEANRIFGHFEWSATNVRLECVAEKERPIGRDKKDGWGVTYICTREVIVGGAVRQGTGAGHGYDVDLGLAHEGAIKEAESDAEKRALRTFGNPFGLALYDKSRENVGKPEKTPEEKFDWFKQVIESQTKLNKLDEFWVKPEFRAHFNDMPPEFQAKLQAIYDVRKAELSEPTADEMMRAG